MCGCWSVDAGVEGLKERRSSDKALVVVPEGQVCSMLVRDLGIATGVAVVVVVIVAEGIAVGIVVADIVVVTAADV